MINTEKLEKILEKKKDRLPALSEVMHLTGRLCKIDDGKFDNAVNSALSKVENLLFLQAQSKKTTGYMLKDSDYKALGIFEGHIKKLRRKSKESRKRNRILKIMPQLYTIRREKNYSYRKLYKYAKEKYRISACFSYFYEIYTKVNKI
ncbi:MAG: hypothetical protein ACYCSQ_05550 [bacterium]